MKKHLTVIAMILFLALCVLGCESLGGGGGGLPAFGAEMGKQSSPMGGDIRAPYTSLISYFGYVKPGSPADEVKNGKKMFYLYVWIPAVAPEIGVRMISPVKTVAKPTDKDFVSDLWKDGSQDMENYFDTWVTFERAATILNPEEIAGKIKSTTWVSYGNNDDSSELPAQPSGNKYNSVLRITSVPSNPLKALVRGLYRIGFTTYKVGEVKGTFLAQVGAPIDLPGVVVAKDPKKILEAVKAKK
jgi:hypothetical protein